MCANNHAKEDDLNAFSFTACAQRTNEHNLKIANVIFLQLSKHVTFTLFALSRYTLGHTSCFVLGTQMNSIVFISNLPALLDASSTFISFKYSTSFM